LHYLQEEAGVGPAAEAALARPPPLPVTPPVTPEPSLPASEDAAPTLAAESGELYPAGAEAYEAAQSASEAAEASKAGVLYEAVIAGVRAPFEEGVARRGLAVDEGVDEVDRIVREALAHKDAVAARVSEVRASEAERDAESEARAAAAAAAAAGGREGVAAAALQLGPQREGEGEEEEGGGGGGGGSGAASGLLKGVTDLLTGKKGRKEGAGRPRRGGGRVQARGGGGGGARRGLRWQAPSGARGGAKAAGEAALGPAGPPLALGGGGVLPSSPAVTADSVPVAPAPVAAGLPAALLEPSPAAPAAAAGTGPSTLPLAGASAAATWALALGQWALAAAVGTVAWEARSWAVVGPGGLAPAAGPGLHALPDFAPAAAHLFDWAHGAAGALGDATWCMLSSGGPMPFS
jgi:hypothetical protein